jgi:hypothetical protein
VLSQLFVACKKDDEQVKPAETTSDSGYFIVSSTGSANGRIAASLPTRQEFDLGPLLASDKFIFMIANGGDQPIFDVTLTSDNVPFDVSPKFIAKLPGKKETTIYPLLNVGITHGIRLKGVGSAPLLPNGENKAVIHMKGKTLNGRDTIQVTGQFIVKVNAQVIDVKVLSGNEEAIKHTEWTANTFIVEPAKTVKLVNTGTVAIKATLTYNYETIYVFLVNGLSQVRYGDSGSIVNTIELQARETKDVTSMVCPIGGQSTSADNPDVYYNGITDVKIEPIKDEGVIAKLSNLTLASK